MPTRRGSIQLGGAAAPVEDSAMRAVDVGAAVEGRDSFGEEDDDEVPVKVLASDFDSAAMAPPPPRAPAPAREESLQVFCRLRPLARGEQGGVVDVMDPHTIRSAPPAATQRHASHHVRREARDYTFARVFDAAATQNEVYERTTAPLVDGLFGGRSALLFTYGVTNAGKSYTMMGSPEDNDTAGLLPRSLGAILARAEDQRCEVRLSFLEIYNEHVYDLMAPTGRWAKRRALRVKDVTTRIEVANLTSTRVTSAAHGLELCRAAQSQRKTSKTGLNQTSSRSHAICSLEVRNAAGASTQLMLVDLAGSERGDRTGAAVGGARQKEANHINQSILAVDELFESGPRKAAPPLFISVRALARVEADAPLPVPAPAAERRPNCKGQHGRLRVARRCGPFGNDVCGRQRGPGQGRGDRGAAAKPAAGGADAEPELRSERASGGRGPTDATDPEEAQGARRRAAVAGEPRGHGVDYF